MLSLKKRAGSDSPSAFVVQNSGQFEDDDGSWSTFNIQVDGSGSSGPQSFRAIVSTSSLSTLLPLQEACSNATLANYVHPPSVSSCGDTRGIAVYAGSPSSGYSGNGTSLATEGLTLNSDQDPGTLFGSFWSTGASLWQNYLYLNSYTQPSTTINSSTPIPILGYLRLQYLLPTFGIGVGTYRSTVNNLLINSTITAMAGGKQIPSRSWGYTAGASYDNSRLGSLVLGGYDQSRINGTVGQYNMTNSQLRVSVTSIGLTFRNNSGPASFTGSFPALVDSTLPYLFLPNNTIDQIMARLHLRENRGTGLFYYNLSEPEVNATRSNIRSFSITVTSPTSGSGTPISIEFPYAALEANASWIWNFTSPSVLIAPIRRAPSDTAVLGRAFFQEAYVSADFERRTFNVSQTVRDPPSSASVVTIIPPNYTVDVNNGTTNGTATSSKSSGLSGGAIAGIVIGSLAGAALLAALLFFFLVWKPRRDKRNKAAEAEAKAGEEKAAAAAAAAKVSGGSRPESKEKPLSPELDSAVSPGWPGNRGSMMSDETAVAGLAGRPYSDRRLSELSSEGGDMGSPRRQPVGAPLGTVSELENKTSAAELEGGAPKGGKPAASQPAFEMEGEGHLPVPPTAAPSVSPVSAASGTPAGSPHIPAASPHNPTVSPDTPLRH